MGKTEVGLAFDVGSNQSFVTMEYASKKRLKRQVGTIIQGIFLVKSSQTKNERFLAKDDLLYPN
jgi:hypothetical protein